MIRTFLFTFVAATALSGSAFASIIDWDDHGKGDKDHDHGKYFDHDSHDRDDYKKFSYDGHDSEDFFASGNWDHDHDKKGDRDHHGKEHDKDHDYDHDPKWKIAECNVGRHDHDGWYFDQGGNGGKGKWCHPGSVSAVPLPSAFITFGATLLALSAFAWRRRRA